MKIIDIDSFKIPFCEALERSLTYGIGFDKGVEYVIEFIKQLPPVEAVPVRKGEWMNKCGNKVCTCSSCGEDYDHTYEWIEEWNFCPNCGADMRGEGDG